MKKGLKFLLIIKITKTFNQMTKYLFWFGFLY